MADVDIDPFGDHNKTESRSEEPTGENIPLTPGGGSTWEPEREQETSFGGESQRTRHLKNNVKDLYHVLSEKYERTSKTFHFDDFKLKDGKLYHRDKSRPLMKKREAKIGLFHTEDIEQGKTSRFRFCCTQG